MYGIDENRAWLTDKPMTPQLDCDGNGTKILVFFPQHQSHLVLSFQLTSHLISSSKIFWPFRLRQNKAPL